MYSIQAFQNYILSTKLHLKQFHDFIGWGQDCLRIGDWVTHFRRACNFKVILFDWRSFIYLCEMSGEEQNIRIL